MYEPVAVDCKGGRGGKRGEEQEEQKEGRGGVFGGEGGREIKYTSNMALPIKIRV